MSPEIDQTRERPGELERLKGRTTRIGGDQKSGGGIYME